MVLFVSPGGILLDAGLEVSAVALAGAVAAAGIALYGQLRSQTLSARHEAENVLRRYREPLATAAYELQGRLYNIVQLGFLRKYYVNGDDAQKTYAVENTLYVIAQYLGWSEILRREIQFLSFSDSARTRAVAEHQRRIVELFQSDALDLGRPFLIWRGEQRAIGERMIERDGQWLNCLGYATFLDHDKDAFGPWLRRLEGDIATLAQEINPRLSKLQHALVDLIRELDSEALRFADQELQKVSLGARPAYESSLSLPPRST
jgi:hypothetical protein